MNRYVKDFLDHKFAVKEEKNYEFGYFADLLREEDIRWNSNNEFPGNLLNFNGNYIAATEDRRRIWHNTWDRVESSYPGIKLIKASDIITANKMPDFTDIDPILEG